MCCANFSYHKTTASCNVRDTVVTYTEMNETSHETTACSLLKILNHTTMQKHLFYLLYVLKGNQSFHLTLFYFILFYSFTFWKADIASI
jgi:hypothetical protein